MTSLYLPIPCDISRYLPILDVKPCFVTSLSLIQLSLSEFHLNSTNFVKIPIREILRVGGFSLYRVHGRGCAAYIGGFLMPRSVNMWVSFQCQNLQHFTTPQIITSLYHYYHIVLSQSAQLPTYLNRNAGHFDILLSFVSLLSSHCQNAGLSS